jgi:hypothetical protein
MVGNLFFFASLSRREGNLGDLEFSAEKIDMVYFHFEEFGWKDELFFCTILLRWHKKNL